jgi:VWFA-related protein
LLAGTAKKDSGEGEPVIRVDVRQVLVPVVVLDNSGHNVSDLKQSDFRVLEDNVEQTVTSFHVETTGAPAVEAEAKPVETAPAPPGPAKPALTAPAPALHTYLVVIDSLHAAFGNLHYVREALQKFFASELPGDSRYGVVALGQTMLILQNMTRDPAVALAALDDKAFLKMFSGSRNSASDRDMQNFVRHLNEIRAMVDSPDPATHDMGVAMMKGLPMETEGIAGVDRINTLTLIEGLRSLVRQMAAGTGHRTLLLISDGFQLSPGRDAWELLDAYFPGLAGMRALDRMQSEFESVVKVAARSNIVIDTIDSRGLYTPSFADASTSLPSAAVVGRVIPVMSRLQTEAGAVLSEFAAATGGTSYQNSNDLFAGIRKAVADGRDYYTLGYVSANTAMDGKFRKITVLVRGRKVTVRAKRGYWATEN